MSDADVLPASASRTPAAASRETEPGSLREFLADVRRVFTIFAKVPWLPALEGVYVILGVAVAQASVGRPEDPTAAAMGFLVSMFALVTIGWLGAQRVIMRNVMLGEPAPVSMAWRLTAKLGWRFVRLGLLLVPVGAVFLAITVLGIDDLTDPSATLNGRAQAAIVVLVLLLAIALTLVTPSLALESDKARDAYKRGVQRLRTHWRLARWHALAPAMALAALPQAINNLGASARVVSFVAALSLIVARGAVVALHLRIRDIELANMPPPRPVIL
ncbi:MAG: hypothetical protein ACI867_001621 [Glaciecola sp.]|jgi:hypothetical protein